jgi:microcystin-dependent protein
MGLGYLTPNTVPTDSVCRSLFIPNDEGFIAVVTGALNALVDPLQWEKYGTLTQQQAADACKQMFDDFCFDRGRCRMVGEIIPYAAHVSPDPKWLPCDGASLLRSAYPDLFAIIGATYGSVDGAHFNIPDLQSRSPMMEGTGSGLSTRLLGDMIGEEGHVLTVSELAAHSHTDTGHTHVEGNATPSIGAAITGVPVPSAIPSVGITGSGSAALSTDGGNGAHNTIHPITVINYLIVALP